MRLKRGFERQRVLDLPVTRLLLSKMECYIFLLSLITVTVELSCSPFLVAWDLKVTIQCCCPLMFTNESVFKEQVVWWTKCWLSCAHWESKLVREPYFSQWCSSGNMHANLAHCWGWGTKRKNWLSTDFKVTGPWLMNCYCRFGMASRKLQFDMLINQTDKLASQA